MNASTITQKSNTKNNCQHPETKSPAECTVKENWCACPGLDCSHLGNTMLSRISMGAVSYLNSKPLIHQLPLESLCHRLTLDFPSRLADGLRKNVYDIALVPSIEYLLGNDGDWRTNHHGYQIISNACVAARGEVMSVKIYFRKEPGDVKTMALDEGSRTSATLGKILLAEKYGVLPVTHPLPLSSNPWNDNADAILVIGDRAMHSPLKNPDQKEFVTIWDLSMEWVTWTGLPFVFAMWVAHEDLPQADRIASYLENIRDNGLRHLQEISIEEAPKLKISSSLAEEYLSSHLHFYMTSAEKNGLELYFDLARDYFKSINAS